MSNFEAFQITVKPHIWKHYIQLRKHNDQVRIKICVSGFCNFGFPGKMHQFFWSLARPWAPVRRNVHFFGKPWIRGQFDSLFQEYDSWGPGLDAKKVFPWNREAYQRVVHFKSESSLNQFQNFFKSDLHFKSNWNLNWWSVRDIKQ